MISKYSNFTIAFLRFSYRLLVRKGGKGALREKVEVST